MTKSRFLKAIDRTVKARGGKGVQELESALLPIESIQPDEGQPRTTIDVENPELMDLRRSIQQFGVLEPILVTKIGKSANYRIISGHRRYFASLAEQKSHIPARIFSKKWDVQQIRLIQLSENIHRKDLYPLEIYRCLVDLKKAKMTQAKIGEKLGLSQSAVSSYFSLGKLDKATIAAVEAAPEQFSLRQLIDMARGHVSAEDLKKNQETATPKKAGVWRPRVAIVQDDQKFTLRHSKAAKSETVLLEFPSTMSSEQLLSALEKLTESLKAKDFKEIDEELKKQAD